MADQASTPAHAQQGGQTSSTSPSLTHIQASAPITINLPALPYPQPTTQTVTTPSYIYTVSNPVPGANQPTQVTFNGTPEGLRMGGAPMTINIQMNPSGEVTNYSYNSEMGAYNYNAGMTQIPPHVQFIDRPGRDENATPPPLHHFESQEDYDRYYHNMASSSSSHISSQPAKQSEPLMQKPHVDSSGNVHGGNYQSDPEKMRRKLKKKSRSTKKDYEHLGCLDTLCHMIFVKPCEACCVCIESCPGYRCMDKWCDILICRPCEKCCEYGKVCLNCCQI